MPSTPRSRTTSSAPRPTRGRRWATATTASTSAAPATQTTVTGNRIADNAANGVEFGVNAKDLTLRSNSIGATALGAAGNGVGVLLNGTEALIGGTFSDTILGGPGNLIVHNRGSGIQVNATARLITIRGNQIGVVGNATARPNGANGIFVNGATGVTIGGADAGDANVIAGNARNGIRLASVAATPSAPLLIAGNFIGTNAGARAKLPNRQNGILLESSSGVQVEANVISANGADGVQLTVNSTNNRIQANKIGTGADGSTALGNTGGGVFVQDSSSNNTIGDTAAGALGNVIAFNARGVVIGNNPLTDNSVRNRVQGNAIFGNTELGIDLGNTGVTPNDTQDPDSGPNLLQNFPTLTGTQMNGTNVRVTGTLNSIPNQTFRVEFFASDSGAPSGFGQGKTFLGFQDVATDASGNGSLDVTLTGVTAGQVITATATDALGNTSEFSRWIQPTPPAPLAPPPATGGPGPQLVAVAFRTNGVARVRVQEAASGRVLATWTPFRGYRGKLRLQRRDVNGDGAADIVVRALIHGKHRMRTYDAVTLAPLG
jgi:Right handed beta helix region